MQVILLDDVPKLGNTGDLVNVKPGYARNYLLPKNKAALASERNKHELEHQRREAGKKREKMKSGAVDLGKRLEGTIVTIDRKVGENDKLFGSVTTQDIERELEKAGFEIDRRRILLEQPVKALGIYKLGVKLHADVTATIQLWVVAHAA
jgi:large subunit ribosomal protein L9